MYSIIDITFPIFGIGLIGFAASRTSLFPEVAARGLGRFVFDYALPIMLVRVFAGAALPLRIPWALLASFYLPALTAYLIGIVAGRRLLGKDFMGQVMTGFGCAFGNLALLGLPLALRYFGDAATVPYFIVLSVHGLCFFTLTTVLLELGRNRSASSVAVTHRVARGLLTNPFILALLAGLGLNHWNIRIPGPLDQLAAYMQQAVVPCALFSLGASLARYRMAGALRESIVIVAVKNVLLPALIAGSAVYIFALDRLSVMIVVLMGLQPVGITVHLFAERYGTARSQATTSVFLSSLVSVITIIATLYLFQRAGWGPR